MRLLLHLAVPDPVRIPWDAVLMPGRGLAYGLLKSSEPTLATQLHNSGWGAHRMVPFGHGAPTFPSGPRGAEGYGVAGEGTIELGSPLPQVVAAWARSLAGAETLDWGALRLRLTKVEALEPPRFAAGTAWFRTVTPVVMKGSGLNEKLERTTRQAWLLPNEPEFPAYFAGNLRRKAETLGLDPDVTLEAVTWIGRKRSFVDGGGKKVGAPVEVRLRGAPETLQAIWSWGLGQSNAAGFGWIRG
jgi:CRISPR-associated endoribonuclease Cas6